MGEIVEKEKKCSLQRGARQAQARQPPLHMTSSCTKYGQAPLTARALPHNCTCIRPQVPMIKPSVFFFRSALRRFSFGCSADMRPTARHIETSQAWARE